MMCELTRMKWIRNNGDYNQAEEIKQELADSRDKVVHATCDWQSARCVNDN